MKNQKHQWAVRLTVTLLLIHAAVAQDEASEDKNRFGFSARFGFNINARFQDSGSLGSGAPSASNRRTPGDANRPGGDPYNYDNGYIFTDISGGADGLTWYWGYDDTASQLNSSTLNAGNFNATLPDNSILLTRTTTVGNAGRNQDLGCDEPQLGFEITYNRELGRYEKLRYGVEAAFSYLNLCSDARGGGLAGVITRTDAYNYVDGTTPPNTGSGGYNQTFSGPLTGTAGFVLSNNVAGSLISTNIATIAGQYKFRADVFGLRLGPYIEFPLGERTSVGLSGGFGVAIVNAEASWREVATTTSGSATRGARGSATDAMWGGYLGLNVSHRISRRWSATAGIQWQSLSDFKQELGAKEAVLEMNNAFFVMVGLSYSF